jgi:D-sedoheptulose 7-phosphate isomerase
VAEASRFASSIRSELDETVRVHQAVASELSEDIARAAQMWLDTLSGGGLIAFCGNGGSAAQCQHLATELVSRFRRDRASYRSLALTTDTSILSAIGNDFGFEQVFVRQVEGLLRAGDLLVLMTTSGDSQNCLLAAQQAWQQGVATIGFTGATGGQLRPVVDLCLCIPSSDTARVQEAHLTIGHILCGLVEAELSADV